MCWMRIGCGEGYTGVYGAGSGGVEFYGCGVGGESGRVRGVRVCVCACGGRGLVCGSCMRLCVVGVRLWVHLNSEGLVCCSALCDGMGAIPCDVRYVKSRLNGLSDTAR